MRINRVIIKVIIIRAIVIRVIIIIIRVTYNDGNCWKSANFGASACLCSHSDYDVFPRTHFILIPRDSSLSFHFHASLHSVVFPRNPSSNRSHPLEFLCIPFFPRSYFHDLLSTIYSVPSMHPFLLLLLLPRNGLSSNPTHIFHPSHLWIAPGQSLDRAWTAPDRLHGVRSRHHHITKPPWPVRSMYGLLPLC